MSVEDARPPVAVVGLGDLGLACALRLDDLGLAPIGVDTSEHRREVWRRLTRRDAVADLEARIPGRVLVCVRTTAQAADVLAALRQLAAGRDVVAYVVTTLEPAFARRLGEHGGGGVRVIELPVSGGRAAARAGELTVMVGGEEARPDDPDFLKRTLAQRAFTFSRFGDATVAKLLNNAVAAYNAQAFANCLAMADRAGVDPRTCAAVIRVASGGSWVADRFDDLIGELLTTDAELLAADLGALPSIDLSDGQSFLAALERARQLLA